MGHYVFFYILRVSPPLWELKRQVRTTFPRVDLRYLAEQKTSFHLRVEGILGDLAKRKEMNTSR